MEKNNAINKGKIDLLHDSGLQLHALLSVLHSFYHQSSGVAAHISSPVWVIRQRLDYQFNRHHTHIHMCCQMHNILITINTTDFTANRLSPTVNKGFTGYPNLHLRVMTNTRQVNTVQKGFVGFGLVNRCVRLMRAWYTNTYSTTNRCKSEEINILSHSGVNLHRPAPKANLLDGQISKFIPQAEFSS